MIAKPIAAAGRLSPGPAAQLFGYPHEIGYGLNLHLVHHLSTMRLDSPFGRAEFIGDLLVEFPGYHTVKHLALALG